MDVGAGLYMCDVVKKSSRSLSHLLMSSCLLRHSVLTAHAVVDSIIVLLFEPR